jgi:hypothetical protein
MYCTVWLIRSKTNQLLTVTPSKEVRLRARMNLLSHLGSLIKKGVFCNKPNEFSIGQKGPTVFFYDVLSQTAYQLNGTAFETNLSSIFPVTKILKMFYF